MAVENTKVTVWITNSNGSQTSVSLQKSGPGFVGPRGEYYTNMPTQQQAEMVDAINIKKAILQRYRHNLPKSRITKKFFKIL
jgi:hypothetical protein